MVQELSLQHLQQDIPGVFRDPFCKLTLQNTEIFSLHLTPYRCIMYTPSADKQRQTWIGAHEWYRGCFSYPIQHEGDNSQAPFTSRVSTGMG
jgi:hypothetical protein